MGLRDYVASREPESFDAVEFPPPSVPRNISAHRESDMTTSDTTQDEPSLDRVNDSTPSSSTIPKNIEPAEINSSSTGDTLPNDDTSPPEKPLDDLDPLDMDGSPTETPTDVNDSLPPETLEECTLNDSVLTKGQPPSSPKPCRASRLIRKVIQPKTKTKPSGTGTLDNYVRLVIRTDSPSTKRKLSNDSVSPSSAQNVKSTRTDGADEVS